MDKSRIIEHLTDYSESGTPYDKYFALWMAFNLMYEFFRNKLGKNPPEKDCVLHCARKLPYSEWIDIFSSKELNSLLSITPIFDERVYIRKGIVDTDCFDKLVRHNTLPITGNIKVDVLKLDALMELLYLVRCHQLHGAKTRKNLRDEEVLSVTEPILKTVVMRLASTFGII